MSEVVKIGNCILFDGDCLEVMKQLQTNSVDLIVTDPPYLIKGNGFKSPAGKLKDRDIFKNEVANFKDGFDFACLFEMQRVLKKWNAYFYCNKELLFELIIWFKQNTNAYLDLLIEHIKNPTPFCNTYLNDCDYVLFVRDSGVKLNGRYHEKVKVIDKTTNKKDKQKYKHPTIKDANLVKRYISNSSDEGDVILDPFMGSGTTGEACMRTNRLCIGIEKNKDFFDIACQRLTKVYEEIQNEN